MFKMSCKDYGKISLNDFENITEMLLCYLFSEQIETSSSI